MSLETYGFKFIVDAKDAAKGYGDFQKAVDGVFASLDRFERHAKQVMDSVTSSSKRGQGDIAKYTNQFKSLARIPVDASAAAKLNSLNAAMRGFKAPNSTQIANLRSFYNALAKTPSINASGTARSISQLSSAMAGFKAPSSAQSLRMAEFAKAALAAVPAFRQLRGIAGVSGIANELATISIALRGFKAPSSAAVTNLGNFALALKHLNFSNLAGAGALYGTLNAISSFRAPTQSQIRNLVSFVNAVSTLKVPPNAGPLASYLTQIARAANVANSGLKGFRGSLNSMNFGGFNRGVHTARVEMMGLQNAFSGTFQVGSLLRTLLGSLTIGELGRNFFEATNAALQFNAQMGVLSKDTKFAVAQLSYINDTARSFGMDMLTAEAGFAKISIAAQKAGMSVFATREMFEGFSTEMTVLGTSTERQNDVWLAVQQVMNKGYLSAEELNQQLNEHLPGAMQYAAEFAKKLGMTLQDALKKKAIDASEVLSYMSKRMKEDFGPSVALALERPAAQMNILRSNIDQLFQTIGDSGANAAFGRMLASFNEGLNPANVQGFAEAIGHGLASAVDRASAAFQWLRANWDSIKGPLATTLSLMGKWMAVTAAFKIGSFIISPLIQLRGVLSAAAERMTAMTASTGRLRSSMTGLAAGTTPLLTGLGRFNITANMAIIKSNALTVAWNLTKRAGSGISALFGGPLGLALTGVGVIIGALTSNLMNMSGVMMDANSVIEENKRQLDAAAQAASIAGGETAAVGSFAAGATPSITSFAGQVGAAAQQLWNMAAAARAARLQQLIGDINRTRSSMRELNRFDTRTFGQDKGDMNSLSNFFGNGLDRATARIKNLWTNGKSQSNLQRTLGQLAKDNRDLTAQFEKERSMKMEDWAPKLPETAEAPMRSKPGGGTKKHHDKANKEINELKSLQDRIDTMFSNFAEDNPLAKLQADFAGQVTDAAQTLLKNSSLKDWSKKQLADMQTGKVSVQPLIDQLLSGGMSEKALKDLKARYHTDVDGIIKMLRESQASYEQNVKEATVKQIDKQMQSVNNVLKRMAEDDPVLKVMQDFTSDITEVGKNLLSADAFTTWFNNMKSGANGAATATDTLIAALQAGFGDPQLLENMKAAGLSVDALVKFLNRMNESKAVQLQTAERQKMIGADLLDQNRQEMMMLTLSEKNQRIMNKLIEEFNRLKGQNRIMTQGEIDDLKKKLTLDDAILDRLAKQREYLENNGIRRYVADLKTMAEGVHDLDYNFLKNMEDTLYKLGTTGKLSFKSLIDGLQSDIIRMASQGIMQKFMGLFNPGGKDNPLTPVGSFIGTLFGGKNFQPSVSDQMGLTLGSMGNPMYVRLDPSSNTLLFGQGGGDDTGGLLGMFGGSGVGGGGTTPYDPAKLPTDLAMGTKDGVLGGVDGAQQGISNSFINTFKGIAPQIGLILASGVGGAVGGKWGGVISTVASIGMMFLTRGASGGAGAGAAAGGMSQSLSDVYAGGDLMAAGFREGGITGSAVTNYYATPAMFRNAPHYAEGTANTSGAHPAILHDNEAVIPLSRGRKVAVELTGGSSGANGGVTVNNNFNISSPDADSFRKSKSQIATDLHAAGARQWSRNNP